MKRDVIYYEWEKPAGGNFNEKIQKGRAEFHVWGVDYEEFETGPCNFSTAVIELPDGTVKNIPVEMIKFID